MSSRYRGESESHDPAKPNCCARVLHYTWKTITCIFSHITLLCLVVLYCLLGAWAFERLEVDNERDVKRGIQALRRNITDRIWAVTREMEYLEEVNWTKAVKLKLRDFENELLVKMTKDGWDGIEGTETVQWTFAGALFYSIIVITTIEVTVLQYNEILFFKHFRFSRQVAENIAEKFINSDLFRHNFGQFGKLTALNQITTIK